MTKQFRLSIEEVKPVATAHGGCIATDMITVDGEPVRYLYREEPHNPLDSGWRFFAGIEDEAYMNDTTHHAVYDVNTIANYDPDIIPLLDAPIGSAFERDNAGDAFVAVNDSRRILPKTPSA